MMIRTFDDIIKYNSEYGLNLQQSSVYRDVIKNLKFNKVFNPSLDCCLIVEDPVRSKYQVRQYISELLSLQREELKVIDGMFVYQRIIMAHNDLIPAIKLLDLKIVHPRDSNDASHF